MCMYLCVCTCAYVYMSVCICIDVYITSPHNDGRFFYIYVCMCVRVCGCMWAYIRACMCTHVCMFVCGVEKETKSGDVVIWKHRSIQAGSCGEYFPLKLVKNLGKLQLTAYFGIRSLFCFFLRNMISFLSLFFVSF